MNVSKVRRLSLEESTMFKYKNILILVLMTLLIVACGGGEELAQDTPAPVPTADKGYEKVSFTTSDDLKISGRLYGEGEQAVILAQWGGCNSQSMWTFFARELVAKGYTVMTFDFRGRGLSKNGLTDDDPAACDTQNNLLMLDVIAATEYLQNLGHEKIACIGSGVGGNACFTAGIEVAFSAVVSLSGRLNFTTGIELTEETMPLIKGRKLIVASKNDPSADTFQFYHDLATEPKELKIFSGNAYAHELLLNTHKEALEEMIFDILADM